MGVAGRLGDESLADALSVASDDTGAGGRFGTIAPAGLSPEYAQAESPRAGGMEGARRYRRDARGLNFRADAAGGMRDVIPGMRSG
jgi:hypothetical protein